MNVPKAAKGCENSATKYVRPLRRIGHARCGHPRFRCLRLRGPDRAGDVDFSVCGKVNRKRPVQVVAVISAWCGSRRDRHCSSRAKTISLRFVVHGPLRSGGTVQSPTTGMMVGLPSVSGRRSRTWCGSDRSNWTRHPARIVHVEVGVDGTELGGAVRQHRCGRGEAGVQLLTRRRRVADELLLVERRCAYQSHSHSRLVFCEWLLGSELASLPRKQQQGKRRTTPSDGSRNCRHEPLAP